MIIMRKDRININNIKGKLEEKGLRITQQRLSIYKALLMAENHPTAEDIYKKLKRTLPGLSLGTVYKTLDTFYKHQIINKIKTDDDAVHYDADLSSHNHIIDLKTNEIIDYVDPDFEVLIRDYFKDKKIEGFEIDVIRVKIYGNNQVN